jgi:upstream activation factor subunit UAF30
MSSAPSDSALRSAALEVIAEGDLNTITMRVLRTQLEEKFGCKLGDKKGVIGEALERYMSQPEEMKEYDMLIKAEKEAEWEAAAAEAGGSGGSGGVNTATPKKAKGFQAVVQLSDELTEFMGVAFMPRTEVTKRLWAYIKLHDLQNPADKREILFDAKLQVLFKRTKDSNGPIKKVHMFKMTKLVSVMMKSIKELTSGDERGDLGDDDEYESEVKAEKEEKKVKKEAKVKGEKGEKGEKKEVKKVVIKFKIKDTKSKSMNEDVPMKPMSELHTNTY